MLMRSMLMLVALIAFFVTGCVQSTTCVGGAEEIDGVCVLPDGAVADSGSTDSGSGDGAIDSGSMDGGPDSGASDTGTSTDSSVVTDSGSDAMDAGRDYRFVFATSTLQAMAFPGGRSGADTLCNDRAETAGLSGSFRAWLSTLEGPAASRLPDLPPGGWHLVGAGGTVGDLVAVNKLELLSDTIGHAIDRTEYGAPILADTDELKVTTGTLADGGVAGTGILATCRDWTSDQSGLLVRSGRTNLRDAGWTQRGNATCATLARIYCFEI